MKTITIYELMGLIKDGQAPYEIIYEGTKYHIDPLEKYYKSEDGTALLEFIFNDYNDYSALQEKVTIPEENDEWEGIEEIKYKNKKIYNETTKSYNTLNSKDKNIYLPIINQLIKNQKYLKEKLKRDE